MTHTAMYGISRYGEKVYGEHLPLDAMRWGILIDWNGDGIFAHNEASRAVGLSIRRGRRFFLRLNQTREAVGFQRVSPGVATVTLDNHDGRYDPFNTQSPLFPHVDLSGTKLVRIVVRTKGGNVRCLFTGILSNIRNSFGARPTTTLELTDGLQSLSDQSVRTKIFSNLSIGQAIDSVLNDSSWPPHWGRDISKSSDIMPYWWSDGRSLDEINNLAEAELGVFFVNAKGQAVFYSRNRISSPIVSIDESEILKDIPVSQPWESVRNRIRVHSNPLRLQPVSVLWQVGDTPEIRPGQSRDYWAEYSHNNSASAAVNVICAAGDFIANSQADGAGINLTANIAITLHDFGKTAKITVRNNAGVSAFLTLLRVRGNALTPFRSFSEASTPPADRLFNLDLPWLQDSNRSTDFAVWLNSYLPQIKRFPTVTIDTRDELQFEPDLFDNVSLNAPTLGIQNQMYSVGMIEHKWTKENGQAVLTTLTLEPYREIVGFWQFTTRIGETSVLGL